MQIKVGLSTGRSHRLNEAQSARVVIGQAQLAGLAHLGNGGGGHGPQHLDC